MMGPTNKGGVMAAVLQLLLAAVLLLGGVHAASSEGYPNRPVRVVVGFPAGGPTDVIARLVSQKLSGRVSASSSYVENIGGAGGNTASGQVARVGRRRLHHHGDQHRLRGQSQPLRQGAVRSGQGFRAGDAGCGFAERGGGQSGGSGQVAAGARAAHPRQSRQVQLCRSRRRLDAASGRRTVPAGVQSRSRCTCRSPVRRRPSGDDRRAHADRFHARCRLAALGSTGGATARAGVAATRASGAGYPACRHSPNKASGIRRPTRITGIVAPAETPKEIVDLLHREIRQELSAQPDVKNACGAPAAGDRHNSQTEFGARIRLEMEKWGKGGARREVEDRSSGPAPPSAVSFDFLALSAARSIRP